MESSKLAQSRAQNKVEPPKGHSVSSELWGIALFALGLILACSLVSYSPTDNALHVHGQKDIHNWIGPGGAVIADFFFMMFGLEAIFLPIIALLSGVFLLGKRKSKVTKIRLLGAGIALFFGAVLLDHLQIFLLLSSFRPGGLLGALASRGFASFLSTTGTLIIGVAGILAGTVLATRWSLGEGVSRVVEKQPELSGRFLFVYDLTKSFLRKLWPFHRRESAPSYAPNIITVDVVQSDDWKLGGTNAPSDSPTPFAEQKNMSSLHILPIEDELHIIERDITRGKKIVEQAEKEPKKQAKSFELPPIKLLDYDAPKPVPIDEDKMRDQATKLEKRFNEFGIQGHVREIRPGPVVTMFEFVPAPGIKLSKIAALADDLAMAMEAIHVRVVAPIPGKGAVGIEIPNDYRELVYLKEIVADPSFRKNPHHLYMAIGKDIEGKPFFMNLADMPHVLIAGTTGSGKSVAVNAMICSILYRATPADVRFLMIDPKMLELSVYDGIPHLLLPPIIDSKKAAVALRWAVKEMDRRYQMMNELGVRDITGYNLRLANVSQTPDAFKRTDGSTHTRLPFIVIVVDEYADLMAVAGRDVENYIMRLAQKARAAGIHVMLATQRPSVDVVTGVIKANFPVRMSFRLAASHDSKTIINRPGAEKLLGKGDMLIMPPGTADLTRVHGAFVSEKELARVVEFWRSQGEPDYDMNIVVGNLEGGDAGAGDTVAENDERYEEAVSVVMRTQKCSTSWLQRQLGVGYNRAARMVEQMEREGVVGPILNAKGEREIFGRSN